MWREILRDIVGGHHITKSLIEIMKQVDSRIAALLLSFKRRRHSLAQRLAPILLLGPFDGKRFYHEDIFHAKRLEALGLLERDYAQVTFLIFIIGGTLIGGYFAYASRESSFPGPEAWLVGLYVALFGGFIITWLIRHPAFRLTWTASQLLKYAKPPKCESTAPESDPTNGTTKE